MFFRLLPSNYLNWKIYCDDHSSLSMATMLVFKLSGKLALCYAREKRQLAETRLVEILK